jgi:hypothetical protein
MKKIMTNIGVILFASLVSASCDNSSNSDDSGSNTSGQEEQSMEDASIDGFYSGSTSISGLELVAELTISGDRWSARSQLGSDSQEYQNGIVNGNDLYDDSGMIKIGYVSGNTARIDGYPSMEK